MTAAVDPFYAGLDLQMPEPRRCAPGEALEPVEVVIERVCAFKKKPGAKRGCARCDAPKKDRAHFGAPPSANEFVSGSGSGNAMKYANVKKLWGELLADAIGKAGLPRGLAHVLVEGEVTFPDRRRRDQGNHRFMLEKALGDALTTGGWLEDDDWTRFEFGGLAARHEAGVSRTRLMLFPSPPEPASEPVLFTDGA